MNNRNSMAAVIYSTELYHHGVEGMSWGERNGPPYPLGGLDKKVARAEAKRKKARERALEKARKAAKKKRKAEARDQKIAARQAKQQEKDQILKEKLLRKGDLKDIQKNRRLFTTQELNDAIVRARVLEEISKDTKRSKKDTTPKEPKKQIDVNEVLRKLAIGAQSIGTISAAALNTAKLVDQIAATKRATKLHDLDVEAKELDLLTKALNAKKSGADPNTNYFRAGKNIPDPSASNQSNTTGGTKKNQNAKSTVNVVGQNRTSASNPDPGTKARTGVFKTSIDDIPTVKADVVFDPGSSGRAKSYWDTVRSMPIDDIPTYTEQSLFPLISITTGGTKKNQNAKSTVNVVGQNRTSASNPDPGTKARTGVFKTSIDDIPTVKADVVFDPGSSGRAKSYWDTVRSMPIDDIPTYTEQSLFPLISMRK